MGFIAVGFILERKIAKRVVNSAGQTRGDMYCRLYMLPSE